MDCVKNSHKCLYAQFCTCSPFKCRSLDDCDDLLFLTHLLMWVGHIAPGLWMTPYFHDDIEVILFIMEEQKTNGYSVCFSYEPSDQAALEAAFSFNLTSKILNLNLILLFYNKYNKKIN